jgi:hypothetical protein
VWDDLPASRRCESIGLNTYEIWHSQKKAAKYEECLVKYFHETDYNLTKKDGANTFDTVASYERRLKFRFGFQQHEASNLFSFLAPALADTPGILDPSHYAELHSQIYTYHLHPGQGQGHCTAFGINRNDNADAVEVRIEDFDPKTQQSDSGIWVINMTGP